MSLAHTKRRFARPLRAPHEAGFSLAEIMVALLVLVVGALFPATHRSAGEQVHASELAAGTVDRLIATSYDAPELGAGEHADPSNPYPGGYHTTWTVENDQPIPRCKRITVTVRWPASSSANKVRLIAVTPKSNQ